MLKFHKYVFAKNNPNILRFVSTTVTPINNTVVPPQYPFKLLSLKLGYIQDIKLHDNSDKMYISQVKIGASQDTNEKKNILQVVSGLKHYIPMDKLLNSIVVVATNLKPSKLRGVRSEGMLMCGSLSQNHNGSNVVEKVELCSLPKNLNKTQGDLINLIGSQVILNEDVDTIGATVRKIKSKELENILNNLYVGDNYQVVFRDLTGKENQLVIKTDNGEKIPIVVESLPRGSKVY
ncbi:uncharacterized protein SCDLUD_001546 [Saccharomycodes ludwigii]|uniref:uncharacterized protein n=1 Tax=Saccharomycodes ludwigii TaxID=36035 RepID=UPI001E828CB3|nr:hypothetical protein SCDLUD_001546 [Saccharomycodes ludwigii]KAH3901768.1 hypothetical protein SCDLUD_001546 [Saccharomycodes ludwigii]